jgi:hypothetical protein
MEMVGHLSVGSDALLKGSGLDIGNVFATGIGLHVLGKVLLMRWHQVIM